MQIVPPQSIAGGLWFHSIVSGRGIHRSAVKKVLQRELGDAITKSGHNATLSVPNHTEVARGTLRSLIAKAGLTVEEFLEVSGR